MFLQNHLNKEKSKIEIFANSDWDAFQTLYSTGHRYPFDSIQGP